jgi:signal peptidase I
MTEHLLLRVLREVALTVGAVVGTLCLVFTLLSATVGVRPLVFTSGSMAPAIETGDLAVTRPVELARLTPGDVVSVFDARGVRITHRVVEVDAARSMLRLKGDANQTADPLPYAADSADLVLFSVPGGLCAELAGRPNHHDVARRVPGVPAVGVVAAGLDFSSGSLDGRRAGSGRGARCR